ncbi:hypothetical protein AK812_SmicGene40098 [Symbiodinium microadriaticum]|uniref:Uncharacterized protein n=1 Tax=Symbiodinium microadriaticum TaxID=2951 RepID=A0A1Q9C9S1_SYMMI|nr:hypothetical protein AK812_SmicGene40098 [Symbiodinium microadriaticum]
MPREPRVLEAIFRDIRDFLHLPVGTEEISLDFKLVIGAQPPLRNRQVIFLNNEKDNQCFGDLDSTMHGIIVLHVDDIAYSTSPRYLGVQIRTEMRTSSARVGWMNAMLPSFPFLENGLN